MNLFATSFPLFVGREVSTAAAERADSSMHDLTKICRIWKLGEEWVTVVATAKGLFKRVTSNKQAQAVRKSRYDYPEMEDSMIMATLRGMPQPDCIQDPRDAPNAAADAEPEAETRVDEAIVSTNRPLTDSFDLSTVFGSEYMDGEDWRLWSFWDDPHLLSNINGIDLD